MHCPKSSQQMLKGEDRNTWGIKPYARLKCGHLIGSENACLWTEFSVFTKNRIEETINLMDMAKQCK